METRDMSDIHSCHNECPRLPCVQRREIERLREALKRIADIEPTLHPARIARAALAGAAVPAPEGQCTQPNGVRSTPRPSGADVLVPPAEGTASGDRRDGGLGAPATERRRDVPSGYVCTDCGEDERHSPHCGLAVQPADRLTITDGFGGEWMTCGSDCELQVVRPGKVQCPKCEARRAGQQPESPR